MIELRDREVAQDQLLIGWPDARELAERIFISMTVYQRDFVHQPLTLHASELPPRAEPARQELRAFVEEWLSYLPKHLPSHLQHPQWDYHFPDFIAARHQHLSKKLGHQTRTTAPPNSFSMIDKCWWRLDGLQKALSQRNVLIELINRQVQTLSESIERDLARQDAENNMRLVEQLGSIELDEPSTTAEHYPSRVLNRTPDREHPETASVEAILSNFEATHVANRGEAERKREKLTAAVGAVRRYYMKRVHDLEVELEQPIAELKAEYDRLIAKRVSTAATPFVRVRVGPEAATSASKAAGLKGLAAQIYRKALGKWPNVTVLNPLWAPVQPLHRAIKRAVGEGAEDVLFVGNRTGMANGIANLPGLHAWVSVEGLTSGNFPKAFDQPPQFDLCICELDWAEAMRFDEIVACARPFVREGGTILGFCLNAGQRPVPPQQLDFSRTGARVTYAGSVESARVVAAHAAIFSRGSMSRVLFGLRVVAGLALLTPRSLLANLNQARASRARSTPPIHCTSVTLEVPCPWFEGDDGTIDFAKAAGVYVTGVEPPTLPERRVDSTVANPAGTAVILTFGQSNAANEGAGAYMPRQRVHVFNIFDMNYYVAADPLPGASGFGGSVWGRLGDRLIEAGAYSSVLFVPIAFGASYIKDWAPGGHCHRRLQFALRRLPRAGVKVDMLCWHQGEADANHTNMPAHEYKMRFLKMVRVIRGAGVQAPIYVAVTSLCEAGAHPYDNREQIRLAQKQIVSVGDGLLPGPDTDYIDGEHRQDGCHFSESGTRPVRSGLAREFDEQDRTPMISALGERRQVSCKYEGPVMTDAVQ